MLCDYLIYKTALYSIETALTSIMRIFNNYSMIFAKNIFERKSPLIMSLIKGQKVSVNNLISMY